MKIVIAGGTGFIGQALIRYFSPANEILILTRGLPSRQDNRYTSGNITGKRIRYIKWNGSDTGDWYRELDGADWLINLTGKSVNCRYTASNKRDILESRTIPVYTLAKAIKKCRKPPAIWFNASSATIYRHAEDQAQDEFTGETGSGFSVDVCKSWEDVFFSQELPGIRKVALRMAIVLGEGGVLVPYQRLVKWGLGGKQGSGKQYFSWIHETDICRAIEWIAFSTELDGVFNLSAPGPVQNENFMRILRNLNNKRWGLPAPVWLLKAGAWLIGTETELLLKSRWVLPARLQQTGFTFKYEKPETAIAAIIHPGN